MTYNLKKNLKYVLKIAAVIFLITLLFELGKEFCFKDLTRWESHVLTIIFNVFSGSVIAFLLIRHQQALRNDFLIQLAEKENYFLRLKNPGGTHQLIQQLMQDQVLFSIVFDTIPVGLWILDGSGEIIFVNEAGKNLWGGAKYVSPEEYTVYKAWFLDSGKFIEAEDWAAVRALRKGETSINEEIKIERFDGKHRIVLNSALPLLDNEKKIIGVLVVNQDITERKKNEEELLKLSQAVENSPAITAITDKDGKIIYVNTMFTKITGYEKEEVIGRNPRILNSGKLSSELYKDMWATINSGSSWNGEFLNRKKNGELYWEFASISPILNSNREINYFVKVGVDLTLRKKAENELRIAEERLVYRLELEKVLNKISAGFVECSDIARSINFTLNKLALSINADSCYLFEFTDEQKLLNCRYEWTAPESTQLIDSLQNLPVENVFEWWVDRMLLNECLVINNVEDLPAEAATIKQILLSHNLVSVLAVPLFCFGKLYGFINFNSVNKKQVWLEEDINLIRTAGDIISHGIERNKYEIILRESEERFRTLVQNVGEGVGIVDENENFIFANPAAHKIFGVTENSLIRSNLKEFIPDDQFNLILQQTASRIKGQVSEYEVEIQCPGGERKSILVTGTPRFHENGSYIGAFGVFRDITERKMLENKLQVTLQKEKELSELKSRFISTASHEFRTPLTTILTSADLLEMFGKKWPEQKYSEHVKKIQNSVYNLTDIINDVLTSSRAEIDKLDFNPGVTNVKELCFEVLNEFSDSDSSKIHLKYIAAAESAVVDKKLIKLILKNLLSNSIKYSKPQELIRFTVSSKNGYFNFAVSDKGIGIPVKDQSRLFEPFFRAENSGDMPGTGLGLSIVKHAVTKHNGKISFKSRPGKGTVFLVVIPFN